MLRRYRKRIQHHTTLQLLTEIFDSHLRIFLFTNIQHHPASTPNVSIAAYQHIEICLNLSSVYMKIIVLDSRFGFSKEKKFGK